MKETKKTERWNRKMEQTRTSEKKDKRVQKTRQGIRTAFIALLKEKRFADITVQDIADRAQISRSTFYDHYTDKYLLLENLYLETVERFRQMAEVYFAPRTHEEKVAGAAEVLDYVIGDAELIHVLMNLQEPGWDLTSWIQKSMEPLCMEYLKQMPEDRYHLGPEFVVGVYTYLITYAMKWIAEHQRVEDFPGLLELSMKISGFFYEK